MILYDANGKLRNLGVARAGNATGDFHKRRGVELRNCKQCGGKMTKADFFWSLKHNRKARCLACRKHLAYPASKS